LDILQIAKKVIQTEANEISKLQKSLSNEFIKIVLSILNSKGKVIISGVGKSGLIGKKISATLSSTGTPSIFLHPTEAYHGDLGVIEKNDIVFLISNSGESDEVLQILPFLKQQGNVTVAMSGKENSTLSKNTDYFLNIGVEKETCPLQLAPTSSTTATLVMGDAIAVALMEVRGFKDEDFARFHPGGSLGKRLLTKVSDVMFKNNLPICERETGIKKVIEEISRGKHGLVVVLQDESIVGIITDGDIRRSMEKNEENFFKLLAKDIMTENPKIISPETKMAEAEDFMKTHKINSLLVEENSKLVGIIQIF
jgi:arabinose-5-phosphate isomerase